MSNPFLRMAELTLHVDLPSDAKGAAEVVLQIVLNDITAGRLTYLQLLTFSAKHTRLWQLHDVDKVDDVVRAIAVRESAHALAFVYPGPIPDGVEGERAYTVMLEMRDTAYEYLVALAGGEGLGGTHWRLYGRLRDDESRRWIGVPPETQVDMWVEGFVGAMGPIAEA